MFREISALFGRISAPKVVVKHFSLHTFWAGRSVSPFFRLDWRKILVGKPVHNLNTHTCKPCAPQQQQCQGKGEGPSSLVCSSMEECQCVRACESRCLAVTVPRLPTTNVNNNNPCDPSGVRGVVLCRKFTVFVFTCESRRRVSRQAFENGPSARM